MNPKNLNDVQESFTVQAENFETKGMSFSKREYLDYTVRNMNLKKGDTVLEAAAGTCVCGRVIAPFVKSVVCLDATPAMLAVGETEAKKQGIDNMQFINGYVEEIPFADQNFDIVLTRLAFHHFTDMEKPFAEMNRVLKPSGQLVVIDMEASIRPLREVEDKIETMRDPSHVKNRSQEEILALYKRYDYHITKQETTRIPVSLTAWMDLTNTPVAVRREIERLMEDEMQGGKQTGFCPYRQDGEIYFEQRWVMFVGERSN